MEDIASNQDNPSNVTVTLTAARVSVLPQTNTADICSK